MWSFAGFVWDDHVSPGYVLALCPEQQRPLKNELET
jgi:hypothetical protein